MENASEALHYAFAIFVFILALSIAIPIFSQAKSTADMAFYMTDNRNFYQNVELTDEEKQYKGRVVGIETIIPTLYRYYKEFYVVKICDKNGQPVAVFDLNAEVKRIEMWTGNTNTDAKLRLDLCLGGENGIINSQEYKITGDEAILDTEIKLNGLYDYSKNRKFVEEYAYTMKNALSELETEEEITLQQEIDKVTITYREI